MVENGVVRTRTRGIGIDQMGEREKARMISEAHVVLSGSGERGD